MSRKAIEILLCVTSALWVGQAFAQVASDVVCSNCVDTGDIAVGAVNSARIANGEVKAVDIAPSAVTSAHILDGQVKAQDLAIDAVTTGRIKNGEVKAVDIADGAVTTAKLHSSVQESLQAAIDALVGGRTAATCAELAFDGEVWGNPAAGFDLRARTNSTMHFLGCPTNGCDPGEFFCEEDGTAETLHFGTTAVSSALRVLLDPGNTQGDAMPTSDTGCSSAAVDPDGITNAPDTEAAARALCRALGYNTGTVVAVASNTCPEADDPTGTGIGWGSDFVNSSGYGKEYTCTGYTIAP